MTNARREVRQGGRKVGPAAVEVEVEHERQGATKVWGGWMEVKCPFRGRLYTRTDLVQKLELWSRRLSSVAQIADYSANGGLGVYIDLEDAAPVNDDGV
jgi:hypothetical protein